MLLHVNYVRSTCTVCMSCYVMLCYFMFVMLCYGRFGRRLVVRISVPRLTMCHFVHLTNKRLVRLVTCKTCKTCSMLLGPFVCFCVCFYAFLCVSVCFCVFLCVSTQTASV